MAVGVGRADDSSMIARKLCDVRIVIVGSQAYPQSVSGEPKKPHDLAHFDCVIDAEFPRERETAASLRNARGAPIDVAVGRPPLRCSAMPRPV